MPNTREALQALPGVGRKTANVVLNIAFGQPTMAVDTHIFRIGNRTGLAPGKDPLAVELKLLDVIPAQYMMHAHHWLILHGRYTCLAPEAVVREMRDRRPVQMAGQDGAIRLRLKPVFGSISSARGPRQPLVHVHHHRHRKQRRGEIDDRDRHEHRDQQAGET